MPAPRTRVRTRRAADLPALAEVLMAQQAETRYPYRDPLPVPVADFLHAHDAGGAWTLEVGGRPAGHACWVASSAASASAPDDADLRCAAAHGCDPAELGWVSALFVDRDVRGTGGGRALLDAVVADLRRTGRRPCLQVLPVHAAAERLYRAAGWQEAARVPASWAPPELRVILMVLPA